MNRICAAGTPGGDEPGADLAVDLGAPAAGFGVPRSQNTIWNPPLSTRVVARQDQVCVGVVDPGHVRDDRAGLARTAGPDADHAQVQRGLAAVAAYLQHVVVARVSRPQVVRPVGQARDLSPKLTTPDCRAIEAVG